MLAFWQSVWKPSPKDLNADFNAGAWYERVVQASTAAAITASAAGGSILRPRPVDKVLIVQSCLVFATVAAGETISTLVLQVSDGLGQNVCTVMNGSEDLVIAGAANLGIAFSLRYNGQPLALGGELHLDAVANFSGAVQAKTLSINVQGILVPRGNWQFGP